ncbi:MAG TPA: AmmeMemoRadiSam system protein B [Thauera sp.]|nr:AmmeMemoRadiSam system protein B [Thauera sp.]
MAIASVRPAAVAGQFYPGDERVLRMQLTEMLAAAVSLEQIRPPKALIVPHAGYIYSGVVAANAYRTLTSLRDQIRRVVILGPAHRQAFSGFALPAAQAFHTPLGDVPLSRADWLMLQARDDVRVDDQPHALEHCIEVQLPFLQTVLDRFSLVPILVGDAPDESVAELLEALWGGPETLIVISSDLSHFLPYRQAQWIDRSTVEQMVGLLQGINHEQACGATPVNGLLLAARRHLLKPRLLDLRNSGDTAGDRSRVVGYASIAFCEPETSPHARH